MHAPKCCYLVRRQAAVHHKDDAAARHGVVAHLHPPQHDFGVAARVAFSVRFDSIRFDPSQIPCEVCVCVCVGVVMHIWYAVVFWAAGEEA